MLPVTPRGSTPTPSEEHSPPPAQYLKISVSFDPINPSPVRVLPTSPRRPPALLLAALLAATAATGCGRASALAFGPAPSVAESNATDFLGAISQRFTNVQRAPKFYRARSKLGRYALTPSRLIGDTSIWSADGPGGARILALRGQFVDGHYLFVPQPAVDPPERVGDSRHVMRLRQLGAETSEYEWATSVEQAVGRVRAADVAAVVAAAVASVTAPAAGGASAATVSRQTRADYAATFPRSAAALGQLFSLDSVVTVPGSDGGVGLALRIGLHPERLERPYPAFAEYVRKYVAASRYHFVLRDATGARWFDAAAKNNVLTVRLRATPEGRLLPLDGAPRPMPDALTLSGEFYTHIMLFDVGVSDLQADFRVLRSEHERGWQLRFRTEPDWHLPLASRYLIRAPLRRPFQGAGATLRIALRDADGAQTLLTRSSTIAVQESAILRFLGSLGFSAMSDFAGKSEAEENRFLAEVFGAMRADTRALFGRGGSGAAEP